MNMVFQEKSYGRLDGSFIAAGGEDGIRKLVDCFYDFMRDEDQFSTIYHMHPEDKMISREKLARFLCGWLGGPKRYQEKFGPINIPAVHRCLDIGFSERDQWLTCMAKAVEEQPYEREFKDYLMQQFSVPAEVIRRCCSANL